jgi:molybdopterin converting factor small subunit
VADVVLPTALTSLFGDLPRHVQVEAPTVDGAIDELEQRWPGLRDRLCEPGPALRRHIHVYVDQERAALETPIDERSHVNVIAAISGG